MELRTLKVFVEVVQQGGFTEAARILFSTQSTVSKAIRALEDELGLALLERGSRRTVPTAAGEAVLHHARRMLGVSEDLLSEVAEIKGLVRGTLRLGLPRIGSDALFAPIFARFRSRFPGIEVDLHEAGSARLREQLHSGELDLGGLLLPVPDEFETQQLAHEPLLALVPRGHPLASLTTVRLAEIAEHPLILFATDFVLHATIAQAFRDRRLEPQVAVRTSQIGFMLELVEAGVGVAFLPRMIARLHVRDGVVSIPLSDEAPPWRMALAWRRDAYLAQAARAWLEVAREVWADADDGQDRTPAD